MRRYLAALCLAVALTATASFPADALQLGATPAATESASGWRPAVRAARAYASRRTGFTSFALRTRRRLYGFRGSATNRSASVVKAMLMVAYLNHRSVRGPQAQRSRARPARADDPALGQRRRQPGARLRGHGALVRLARRVGMREFAPSPTWGATRISARDQTKLFLNIDRFVVRRHRRFAMRLLGSIVPYQRWGIAQRPPARLGAVLQGRLGARDREPGGAAAPRRPPRGRWPCSPPARAPPTAAQTEREVARRLLRGLGPARVPR